MLQEKKAILANLGASENGDGRHEGQQVKARESSKARQEEVLMLF